MPVRQMSTYVKEDEERVRKIEQEGYNVLYTAEVQNYMDSKIPWKPTSEEHIRLY